MNEPSLLPVEEPGAGTAQTAVAGPGKRLCKAREAQGLSIARVANQLHLDPRLISALERNDYEHLPEPIYVTGYLRNYARLLRLPEGEVVSAYQQLDIPPPPILSDLTRKVQRRTPLNHVLIQWAAVAVVSIGLTLVGWHMSGSRRGVAPHDGASPAPAAIAVAPPVASSAAPPAVGHAAAGDAAIAKAAPLKHLPARGGRDVSQVKAVSPPPVASGMSTVVPDAQAATSPGVETTASTTADESPVPAGPSATVQLQFNHDSWVEVTDAAGQRVFYDMGKAGQTRTFHGSPPFSVLLGYSPGVSIEYNGKPFDQSAFTSHNNVARFTMDTGG